MDRNRARSTRLEARLSPETIALVKRAAEIEGRSVSDFVVAAAREAAQRTIAETQVFRLALADQPALADALGTPAKPAPALQRARRIAGSSPRRGDCGFVIAPLAAAIFLTVATARRVLEG